MRLRCHQSMQDRMPVVSLGIVVNGQLEQRPERIVAGSHSLMVQVHMRPEEQPGHSVVAAGGKQAVRILQPRIVAVQVCMLAERGTVLGQGIVEPERIGASVAGKPEVCTGERVCTQVCMLAGGMQAGHKLEVGCCRLGHEEQSMMLRMAEVHGMGQVCTELGCSPVSGHHKQVRDMGQVWGHSVGQHTMAESREQACMEPVCMVLAGSSWLAGRWRSCGKWYLEHSIMTREQILHVNISGILVLSSRFVGLDVSSETSLVGGVFYRPVQTISIDI